MPTTANPAIDLVLAVAVWEVVKYAVNKFLRRTVDTNYITDKDCEKCNGKAREKESALEDKLSELRGIVLVIAVKVGIDEKEIRSLVK